jgi:hypothetical protein
MGVLVVARPQQVGHLQVFPRLLGYLEWKQVLGQCSGLKKWRIYRLELHHVSYMKRRRRKMMEQLVRLQKGRMLTASSSDRH